MTYCIFISDRIFQDLSECQLDYGWSAWRTCLPCAAAVMNVALWSLTLLRTYTLPWKLNGWLAWAASSLKEGKQRGLKWACAVLCSDSSTWKDVSYVQWRTKWEAGSVSPVGDSSTWVETSGIWNTFLSCSLRFETVSGHTFNVPTIVSSGNINFINGNNKPGIL